jgi:hypothetical protein
LVGCSFQPDQVVDIGEVCFVAQGLCLGQFVSPLTFAVWPVLSNILSVLLQDQDFVSSALYIPLLCGISYKRGILFISDGKEVG